MKAHIEHQVIEKDGVPLFVLVPYDEYFRPKRVLEDEGKVYLPHEVVVSHTIDGKSLPRAWREHKGLSQEDVAKRMKISQESYCQMEKPRARLRQTTRQRIAAALEIEEEQLRI